MRPSGVIKTSICSHSSSSCVTAARRSSTVFEASTLTAATQKIKIEFHDTGTDNRPWCELVA